MTLFLMQGMFGTTLDIALIVLKISVEPQKISIMKAMVVRESVLWMVYILVMGITLVALLS